MIEGTGVAMAFPALMTIAVRSAPASERGAVIGTFTSFFDAGFGVGAVTLGVVSDGFGFYATERVGHLGVPVVTNAVCGWSGARRIRSSDSGRKVGSPVSRQRSW